MSTEIPSPGFSSETAISPEVQERANQLMEGLRKSHFDEQYRAYRNWIMLTDPWKAAELIDRADELNRDYASELHGANTEATTWVQTAMNYEDRKNTGQLSDEEKARDLAMTTLYPEGQASIDRAQEEDMLRKNTPEMIAYYEHQSGKRTFESEDAFRARIEEIRVQQAKLKEQ